jgi:hypothetical protein
MEFLDINLTRDWSLLLHPIHSLFYSDFKENNSFLGFFKKSLQKSAKQENSRLFMNNIL